MTLPVPNLKSPIGTVKNGFAFLIPPWNSWFQQFTQSAPAVSAVTLTGSPFSFTANANGNLVVSGGTISAIDLTRGTTTISLSIVTPLLIPVSIGDTITITYTVLPTLQFLGA